MLFTTILIFQHPGRAEISWHHMCQCEMRFFFPPSRHLDYKMSCLHICDKREIFFFLIIKRTMRQQKNFTVCGCLTVYVISKIISLSLVLPLFLYPEVQLIKHNCPGKSLWGSTRTSCICSSFPAWKASTWQSLPAHTCSTWAPSSAPFPKQPLCQKPRGHPRLLHHLYLLAPTLSCLSHLSSTPRYIPKKNENMRPNKNLYTNVCT